MIPGCLGTAAMGLADPRSFEWCTCEAALPTEKTPEAALSLVMVRVAELEARIAELEESR
ncbi:hypothetical protein ACWGMA_08370 [Streptomyces asiaticus]